MATCDGCNGLGRLRGKATSEQAWTFVACALLLRVARRSSALTSRVWFEVLAVASAVETTLGSSCRYEPSAAQIHSTLAWSLMLNT